MATFASGGFHGLRYVKETTFGVTPPNPQMKGLRHTSCSLILTKDTFQSQELRSDAQISDLRHGNRRVSGDIGFEFSFEEYEEFLAAAIRSSWVADGDNRSLVAGTAMSSYTFERIFNDIQQYEDFTGCEVSTFALTVATNAMVTGTMGIVGKNISFGTAPLDANPDPSFAFSPFDGFRGKIMEGGTEIAVVTSVEFTIDNAIEPAFVIGSDSANALLPGRINITGTLTAFFENTSLLSKFVNETESSLVFTLGDGESKSYTFTFPRIKYTGGDNPVDGEGPVTLSMPFQAIYDDCTGTNFRVDAIPGAAEAPCALTYDGTDFEESTTTAETIENHLTVTLSGGDGSKTFNGILNQEVPGVTFTGIPDGMTGSVIKTGDKTAEVHINGTASSALTATPVTITFSQASVSFGFCRCPDNNITGAATTANIVPAA